jgi:protease-4
MRKCCFLLILGVISIYPFYTAFSAPSDTTEMITFPSSSISVTDDALATRVNPAFLGFRGGVEAYFLYPYLTGQDSITNNSMGLAIKLGGLGFTGEFANDGPQHFNRYTLGSGFSLGSGLYFGLSHEWYRVVDWQSSWNVGLGYRPLPFLSLGSVIYDLNEPNRNGVNTYRSYGASLAVRPIGHRLTLAGDVLFTKRASVAGQGGYDYGDNLDPRLLADLSLFDGFRLTGDYRFKSKYLGIGVKLAVDNLGVGNYRLMDQNGDRPMSVAYAHLTSARQPNIFSPPSHQIVEVSLEGAILEAEPPFTLIQWGKKGKTLQQLRNEIQAYADDPRVDGLLINFNGVEIGLAQMQQLRRALEEFKAAGKKLIAWSEDYTQSEYYLATVCDEIHLLPVGFVDLHGLAATLQYYKGTLDKLGVGIQLIRVGDYKTAGNAFAFEDTPPAEAEMFNWLLDDIYQQILTRLGEGRDWTVEEVQAKIDAGPYDTHRALEAGLVDSLHYYDEITKTLKDSKYHLVSDHRYWAMEEYEQEWPDIRTPKVAVIYAEGAIVSGNSGSGFFGGTYMGAETIAKAIRTAREDHTIDAIILRVDSPGGSGIASDIIYREVLRTTEDKKNRKPIIVSMGNVAGSGGYYISVAADTIIAEPGTITGSIGVIFLKPNFEGTYKKIHLNTHTFKRGEHADALSTDRPMTDPELEMMQEAIRNFYDDFIGKVADLRGMSKAAVDSIGAGRVWTGSQAKDRGLVDLLGGMDLAFEIIRGKLGIEEGAPMNLEFYPKQPSFLVQMASGIGAFFHPPMPKALTEALEPLELTLEIYDGQPLLLMPCKIEIK